MPREKELFRENLDRLKAVFPHELIPIQDAAGYVGLDARTLRADKTFPVKKISGRFYVGVAALARWLS